MGSTAPGASAKTSVLRFQTDGNAGSGFNTRDLSPGDDYASELVVQDDDKIVVSAFTDDATKVGEVRFLGT